MFPDQEVAEAARSGQLPVSSSLTSLLVAMPAREGERMSTSLLVEQADMGSSLFRNVRRGRIPSEAEVIPRDANTHSSAQLSSPLEHEDLIPRKCT